MTECLSVPGSEVSCDSASCAGGQYETDCTHSSQSYCTWTQPSGGVLDPQSQADSQTTSMPGFSEDISGSDVLKSVLVCLVYCATVAYVVLNVFLKTEVCLYFACPLGFCYSHSSHGI